MPVYHPGGGAFVALDADGFVIGGQRFVARGINYYPARSPWQRFHATSLPAIERDFAALKDAHVNTVRLFLWHEPMFVCPGHGAVPDPAAFDWLDALLRLASAYGFRVILTLNHLPDLAAQPLYTDQAEALAQTAYIVTRYRDEPAILAWDLRDAGDTDYTSLGDMPAPFTRAQVLDWLARTAAAVREIDPNHMITAGWANDSEATISLVDVVSFQRFGDAETLRQRVAALRALTDKPLLLIAFGYSTLAIRDTEQAQQLRAAVRAAEGDRLAGWLVWTMYDFPTDVTCWPEPCASLDDARHHYGLWRADGSRKPAANALETLAGQ
jgi:endo-1,4-beta-mannosidase